LFLSTLQDINIAPNPTTGNFKVEIEGNNFITVNIYNISGRLVSTFVNVNSNTQNFTLIGSPGVYFIEVEHQSSIHRFKIIKL